MRVRLCVLMMALGGLLLGAGWVGVGGSVVDVGGVALLVTGAFATALAMGEPDQVPLPVEERVEV
jgi:hypothetical protein